MHWEPVMDIKILVVDDEPYMAELIERVVRGGTSYAVGKVSQSGQVLPLLESGLYNLVFLDLRMPGMDGMQLLKEIKRRHPQIDVIIVTAYGTVDTAVEALQHGAADFVTKPFVNQELLAVLERVIRLQDLTRQNLALRRALAHRYSLENLIGHGPGMKAVLAQAAEAAKSDAPVVLLGEFGTGKSHLARALHFSGPRAAGPFTELDLASCGSPEMERLLFGKRDEKDHENQGVLASAEGGTLHLAGVEYLPSNLRNRLADWLEQGLFRPPDARHLESSDVRLILSSEKEAESFNDDGGMQDRLALLAGRFILRLPPLRARREDIILLAGGYLEKLGRLYDKQGVRLSDGAVKWLLAQDWPGNLRELENALERALLLSPQPVIEAESLARPDALSSHLFSIDFLSLDQPFDQALDAAQARFRREFEEAYLRHHLQKSRGDLELAQVGTDLSPEKLRAMIARSGITLKSFRKGR